MKRFRDLQQSMLDKKHAEASTTRAEIEESTKNYISETIEKMTEKFGEVIAKRDRGIENKQSKWNEKLLHLETKLNELGNAVGKFKDGESIATKLGILEAHAKELRERMGKPEKSKELLEIRNQVQNIQNTLPALANVSHVKDLTAMTHTLHEALRPLATARDVQYLTSPDSSLMLALTENRGRLIALHSHQTTAGTTLSNIRNLIMENRARLIVIRTNQRTNQNKVQSNMESLTSQIADLQLSTTQASADHMRELKGIILGTGVWLGGGIGGIGSNLAHLQECFPALATVADTKDLANFILTSNLTTNFALGNIHEDISSIQSNTYTLASAADFQDISTELAALHHSTAGLAATSAELQSAIHSWFREMPSKMYFDSKLSDAIKDLLTTDTFNSKFDTSVKGLLTANEFVKKLDASTKDLLTAMSFTQKLNDATKDLLTTDAFTEKLGDAIKDVLTTTDFAQKLEEVTKALLTSNDFTKKLDVSTKDLLQKLNDATKDLLTTNAFTENLKTWTKGLLTAAEFTEKLDTAMRTLPNTTILTDAVKDLLTKTAFYTEMNKMATKIFIKEYLDLVEKSIEAGICQDLFQLQERTDKFAENIFEALNLVATSDHMEGIRSSVQSLEPHLRQFVQKGMNDATAVMLQAIEGQENTIANQGALLSEFATARDISRGIVLKVIGAIGDRMSDLETRVGDIRDKIARAAEVRDQGSRRSVGHSRYQDGPRRQSTESSDTSRVQEVDESDSSDVEVSSVHFGFLRGEDKAKGTLVVDDSASVETEARLSPSPENAFLGRPGVPDQLVQAEDDEVFDESTVGSSARKGKEVIRHDEHLGESSSSAQAAPTQSSLSFDAHESHDCGDENESLVNLGVDSKDFAEFTIEGSSRTIQPPLQKFAALKPGEKHSRPSTMESLRGEQAKAVKGSGGSRVLSGTVVESGGDAPSYWLNVFVGPKASTKQARTELRDTLGSALTVQVHNRDTRIKGSSGGHRGSNADMNKDRPTICWVSQYLPLDEAWPGKDDTYPKSGKVGVQSADDIRRLKDWWIEKWTDPREECPYCTWKREMGKPTHCFFFIEGKKKNIDHIMIYKKD